MGLDVSFSKQEALNAGLVVTMERRGTEEQIAAARSEIGQSPLAEMHLEWLEKIQPFVTVPGTQIQAAAFEGAVKPEGLPDIPENWTPTLEVRANRWGDVYEPLTQWLKSKNIVWDEF